MTKEKEIEKIEPADNNCLPLETWEKNTDVIKKFLELLPDYEHLCDEIRYILRKRLEDKGIEISTITCRAKTLKSFLEKIERKNYKDCFEEITDIAGVRVVYLYLDDLKLIEEIINEENEEFEVIEKSKKEPNEFGYVAIHYIVKLGKKSSGARYDDLKGMKCEVQVRTVLQDAWAIFGHHLEYKKEADAPKTLRPKLKELSDLFGNADKEFQQLRIEREEYNKNFPDPEKDEKAFLNEELNMDSLKKYLLLKFEDMEIGTSRALNIILRMLQKSNFSTLLNIDNKYQKISENVNEIKNRIYEYYLGDKPPSCVLLAYLIAIVDINFRKTLRQEIGNFSENNFLSALYKEFEPK